MVKKENLFSKAPFGYALQKIVLDENGKPVDYTFTEVNTSFEEITGLTKSQIIGKTVTEAIPEITKDSFDWIGFYGKIALEDTTEIFDQFSETLGKHYRIQAYSPQKDYFITLFSDISQEKKEQKKLEGYSELLKNVSKQIPGVIYQYRMYPDGSACFPFASENIKRIYDITPEEVKKDATLAMARLHPDDHDRVTESIIKSRDTLEEWEDVYRVILPQRGERWLRGNAQPELLEDGSVVWHGYIFDVTEKKQAEAELELATEQALINREKYRTIFNKTQVAILIADDKGKYLSANGAACKLLGYSLDEILNMSVSDLQTGIKTSSHDLYREFLSKTEEKGEFGFLTKTGESKIAFYHAVRVRENFNLSMLVDITKQKEMEKELIHAKELAESANKAKSEFLANMSHEIRTPMNSVIGFSELLEGTTLNGVQKQYVKTIISSGKGLLGIINDILDFSKIEAGKLDIEFIQADIIELMEQTADLIKHPANQKNIELLLNIDFKIPRFAMVDPARLRQVLANLLSNALKFTERGETELKASLIKKKGRRGIIEFSVRDTGIGISNAQRANLFKAFSQADNSTTRKFGGTGLGLVISEELVHKMGGKLEFESIPDGGSRFFFSIETEIKEGGKIETFDISNIKRCLVIDDNPNNRTIMEDIMANWGIECVSCDNGFESLKTLEKSKAFDVIVCDYHMPYIDGLETVRLIREKLNLSPDKQPVILLHSSSDDAELHDKCKELGIFFRLTKPVKQSELLHCFLHLGKGRLEEFEDLKTEKQSLKPTEEIEKSKAYKILIAEDNPDNMRLVTVIIKRFVPEAEIIQAQNGKDAYDKIIELQPDIVFMDVQMPIMDGNEATLQLRKYEAKEKLHRTIVVGLTAGALKQEKQKSLGSGMDEFLTKPLEPQKLKDVLTKYIKVKNDATDNI